MSAAIYALCPVCLASVRVRRDGKLREHTRPVGLRWRRRCEGSGRAALTQDDEGGS